jgi:hypothetical protein
VLRHNLKIGFGLVAEVVRLLKAPDLVNFSSDFGILTNSATLEANRDRALATSDFGWVRSSSARQLRSLDGATE